MSFPGGDLKVKNTGWGCPSTNSSGRLVRDTRKLEVFAPAEAISITSEPRRGDILDIFLEYRMAATWEVQTQYAPPSDGKFRRGSGQDEGCE